MCVFESYGETDRDDGLLEGSWVVVDVVGAKGEHAHEEEKDESVEPPPRVAGKEGGTEPPLTGATGRGGRKSRSEL